MKAIASPRVAGGRLAINEAAIPAHLVDASTGWIRIDSDRGWTVARYRTHAEDGDPASVRLGRGLWTRLEVRPGEDLQVGIIEELPDAVRVTVDVASNRTDEIQKHLTGSVELRIEPLFPGTALEIDHPDIGRALVHVRSAEPAPSRIGPFTIVDVFERDEARLELGSSLADVGGYREALDELRRQIELPLLWSDLYREAGIPPPKGAILHGPPGTGKTLICRAVARSLGVTVKAVSGGDLARSLRGETEKILRDLFRDAARAAPTLILVDEFDALGGHRDRMSSQDDVRTVSQLLTLMDGLEQSDGVVVLATTNRLSAVDDAFLRPGRFDLQIRVGAPDEADRLEILAIHGRDMPFTFDALDELKNIARHTAGYMGADLMHLARLAALNAVERTAAPGRLRDGDPHLLASANRNYLPISVKADDLRLALANVRPSTQSTYPTSAPTVAWDTIIGLDEVKSALMAAASAAFGRTDRPTGNQGVLLSGPPGNGKTILAEALARETDATLVTLHPARIFRPWLGESEEALRDVFERASLSRPAVLVIEHINALASARRSNSGERTDDRVKAALIAAIDEAIALGGVLVIGIVGDAGEIDPALSRAGRLGNHLAVSNPDADLRRQLLSYRNASKGDLPTDLERLVDLTDGASSADLLLGDLPVS